MLYDDHAKFPSISTGEPPGIKMNSDPNPLESQFKADIFLYSTLSVKLNPNMLTFDPFLDFEENLLYISVYE